MELNTKYYEEMFERFTQQCPMWVKDVVEYRPKNLHAIRVKLRNGEQIDYNIKSDTFRYVRQTDVMTCDDINDDEFRKIFANNLTEIMQLRGIGQAVLAERTGLSSAMISKYIHEKSTPTMVNVKRIARALNCHPDELYD